MTEEEELDEFDYAEFGFVRDNSSEEQKAERLGITLNDAWEDTLAFEGIREKYPTQHIVKVTDFNGRSLGALDRWLGESCDGKIERIGWSSGCSYTVAVAFWELSDAVYFKMAWRNS